MKCTLLILFVFSLHIAIFGAKLEGVWSVEGYDPYEKQNYTGTAMVTADKNGVFQFVWMLGNKEKYRGTGIVTNNVLSVIYSESQPEENQYMGVGAYTLGANENEIEGKWVMINSRIIGTEKLTRK